MNDKLARIREQLPATQKQAFLNTGWYGPLPVPTMEAIQQATEFEYTRGRPIWPNIERIMGLKLNLRQSFADFLDVDVDTLSLVHHTTDGMNIVTMGFNWQPGDEVATTTIEHEAGVFPLYTIKERYGVKINFAEVGLGEDPLEAIDAALTPKTRLLSISHVSYSSGARFPMEEVIALAHSKNIPVVVDGAQSAGVFPLELKRLNVDFYAIPGQKWLCGPEGIGVLYVRPDWIERLHPTYTNYRAIERHDWHGDFSFTPTAVRYDTGTIYPAILAGMQASLDWFVGTVEPEWAYERIAHVAAYARQRIGALEGVRLRTPANRQASLVNFLPVGWSAAQMAGMVATLESRGIVIRSIPHEPYAVRVSCGFYNTDVEIDGLARELEAILQAGPDAVTVPDWAVEWGLSTEPVR